MLFRSRFSRLLGSEHLAGREHGPDRHRKFVRDLYGNDHRSTPRQQALDPRGKAMMSSRKFRNEFKRDAVVVTDM